MVEYLKFLLDKKIFSNEEFDYYYILKLIMKDKYINRIVLNFYYLLEISIPEDFLTLYNSQEVFKKDDKYDDMYDEMYGGNPLFYDNINNLNKLPDKSYFKEEPLQISIDDLYHEYQELIRTNTSKLLYYINIINYSTYCVKYKDIIKPHILQDLLNSIINVLETFNYNEILILY
jgi:hypothetical protein